MMSSGKYVTETHTYTRQMKCARGIRRRSMNEWIRWLRYVEIWTWEKLELKWMCVCAICLSVFLVFLVSSFAHSFPPLSIRYQIHLLCVRFCEGKHFHMSTIKRLLKCDFGGLRIVLFYLWYWRAKKIEKHKHLMDLIVFFSSYLWFGLSELGA